MVCRVDRCRKLIKKVRASIGHDEERNRLVEKTRRCIGSRLREISLLKIVGVFLGLQNGVGIAC